MLKIIKKQILNTKFETLIRTLLRRPKANFGSSPQYWESRYQSSGTSGSGSYGRLAQFKAKVLNEFVLNNDIETVIEFGSGDGNQLMLAAYPSYIGVDVSLTAINFCTVKFKEDRSKKFIHTNNYAGESAQLALSLDVIYHLIEDEIFHQYMNILFDAANKYVIIYSSNYREFDFTVPHVKHRCFTDWVEINRPDFHLMKVLPNRYPYNESDPDNTSLADFYYFEKFSSD